MLRKEKQDFLYFSQSFFNYFFSKLKLSFFKFESGKGAFATALYRRRGRLAGRFVHSGMAGLAVIGLMIAPVIAEEFPGRGVDPWDLPTSSVVLSAESVDSVLQTEISEKVRDEVLEYTVQPGDTVGIVAEKFGVSTDTLLWQNELSSKDKIKVGQTLQILPVTGISHKVKKGDTVYSIAKKYDVDPQQIVNYPFNVYSNDETFELAIGQTLMVPDGVKPNVIQTSPRIRQITPDAGTVVASGNFVWPASGSLTHYFVWYHQAIDIANRASPPILAADSGVVTVSGWPDGGGYGNRVVINHGNGYQTLYAHLSRIYVVAGQSVNRGDTIGQMGTTGRSTGIHLHFEVIYGGVKINPLSVLR